MARYLAHTYFTDPRARTASPPLHLLFSLVGVVFVGMFLVGVSIPSIGRVTIQIGEYKLELWAIGLVGSFVWLVVGWPIIKKAL